MILRPYTWPGDLTMTLIGGKWRPLIIHHLIHSESLRFNALKHLMPGISAKMLAKHLRELEEDGLVERRTSEQGRITYHPTASSQGLGPVLEAMHRWAKDFGQEYGNPAGSFAYPGFTPETQISKAS